MGRAIFLLLALVGCAHGFTDEHGNYFHSTEEQRAFYAANPTPEMVAAEKQERERKTEEAIARMTPEQRCQFGCEATYAYCSSHERSSFDIVLCDENRRACRRDCPHQSVAEH